MVPATSRGSELPDPGGVQHKAGPPLVRETQMDFHHGLQVGPEALVDLFILLLYSWDF